MVNITSRMNHGFAHYSDDVVQHICHSPANSLGNTRAWAAKRSPIPI